MLCCKVGHLELESARDELGPTPLQCGESLACLSLVVASATIECQRLCSNDLLCLLVLFCELFLLIVMKSPVVGCLARQ